MEIQKAIEKLKREKNAFVLAHHYQTEDIKAIADFVGDSLEMSKVASSTSADLLLVCGVYFMAETAKILSPEKKVLLANLKAGCPMADMVSAERLVAEKEKYPDAKVVCYVNSPASVKALSDICCTSSNAVAVVKALQTQKVLFVPDQNLADYVAGQLDDVKVIPWSGFCPTHHRMTMEEVDQMRALHPDAYLMVHPECRPELVKAADFVGSTSQIIKACERVDKKTIIIATEIGVIAPIQSANPDKRILLLDGQMVCPNMKKTSLSDVLKALSEETHEIQVPQEVMVGAKKAIDRMMEVI